MSTAKKTTPGKCEVVGCKNPAVWIATKLWGKGGTIRTCDECKPGRLAKPGQRSFYDVKPIEGGPVTFEQFQGSGREVDDIGDVLGDDDLIGINGRLYCNDTLYAVPCVTRGVGWSTILGNREHQSPKLEVIERKLYAFAIAEGMTL